MRFFYVLLACVLSSISLSARAVDLGLAAYNPAISLVLMGHGYYDNQHSKGPKWLDQTSAFPNQNDGEYSHQGFNLDGSELSFSSNVDSYFKVWLAATYEDDDVEVEEAWLQTLSLPYGLQLKAGRFLSRIGYQNTKHQHEWDFIDQNLAYQSLFHGEHLNGDGVQLTWLLPTQNYWLLGTEVMQGDEMNGFGQELDVNDTVDELGLTSADELDLKDRGGPNLITGFVHFSPDMGTRQALQLGVSGAFHRNQQNYFTLNGNDVVASGNAWLAGAQAVYKRFASDSYGTHGLTLSAEYFYAGSNLDANYTSSALYNNSVSQRQQAAYLQAVYGFAPRWQVGLRHSLAGFGNSRVTTGKQTTRLHTSTQNSAELTWNLSEFSHLRFELGHERLHQFGENKVRHVNKAMLGYVMIIGAHPAHQF